MARLAGTVSITGLPPHRGLIVSLCFYGVESGDARHPTTATRPPPPSSAGAAYLTTAVAKAKSETAAS